MRWEHGTLTYHQLNTRAHHLAQNLINHGITPGMDVPVLMRRSHHTIITFLAILKTGAAYQPLHTDLPPHRLQQLLAHNPCPLVITDTTLAHHPGLTHHHTLTSDHTTYQTTSPHHPLPTVRPQDTAYTMHTSGTTGTPKAIAITHQSIVDLATDPAWNLQPHHRVLFHAPHAFDASTYEIWAPLLHGAQTVIAPDETTDTTALTHLIPTHHITHLSLTAGMFRVIVEEDPHSLTGLTEITTGGDTISPTAVTRLLTTHPHMTVRTTYGPTETTLCATQQPWTHTHNPTGPTGPVPLGHPMHHTGLLLLDPYLQPVPPGVQGELYITGTGLARGYTHQPALTATHFTANPHPHTPGTRMYRTGDLAHWTPHGDLIFNGRTDHQVKIRGYRIEPAEIETTLTSLDHITDALVTTHTTHGHKHLTAYTVPAPGHQLDPHHIREQTTHLLPDYMVPTTVIVLPHGLPLTTNGKIDHTALPTPDPTTTHTHQPPRTPREEILCTLFAHTLGLDTVGTTDDFFALGGHSLLATQLIARIRTTLGIHTKVRTLFENPTVQRL
ncbi:non-ribosomal peptide synthetase, partial [Nocardiopsis sp. NPDC058631]|uniref:non-ribosomal peptide synthetase n=1 Tax=Nocardiopsis sp. NPDC058631 TaxID=3346566 RepID=UPI0036503BEA